ncbi:hypothetical protein G6F56_006072 [Rhizopus delemar]|nr:hypothetical protein G6F56_006072 [Rhizopus delemar]
MVSGNGIRTDPNKTAVAKTWPTPGSVKALQKFLGFCAFYHRFLVNLADLAKPLYRLLKDGKQHFNWTEDADRAFMALKERMVNLPTLAYPDPKVSYDLHTDASNVGLGAVLVQTGRPIAYASRTHSDAERNYSTTERECLAIIWSLNYFYPYLYGAHFSIYTDHAALKSIIATKMPRGRIARWILTIQSFTFTIYHRKGALNSDADALSRLPEDINSQGLEELTLEEFRKLQSQDRFTTLLKGEVKKPLEWNNGLLGYRNRNDKLVPVLPKELVKPTIELFHNGLFGGHFGVDKTMDKLKEITWWSTMEQDVKEHIRCCDGCQRFKIRSDSTVPQMKPILPRFTGDIWAADIAELPTSTRGNTYILVLMEYLSKWAVTVALPSVTTDKIAQALLFEVVLKFGTPSRLITDNGANLVSDAMEMISAMTGKEDRLNWDNCLPFVTFAYNTAKQASTSFSPYEVLFGRKAVLPLLEELVIDPKTYKTEMWVTYLNNHIPLVHDKALENIKKAQKRQRKFYGKGSMVKYDYKNSDLIMRKNQLKTSFPEERWLGPYKIISKNNSEGTSYKITNIKDKFGYITTANVRHMRPYYASESSH